MAGQLLHHSLDKVVTRKIKAAKVDPEAYPPIIELDSSTLGQDTPVIQTCFRLKPIQIVGFNSRKSN